MSKLKKDVVNISDEVETLFKNIIPDKSDTNSWSDISNYINLNGIDGFITKHKIADENFKKFLYDIGNAKFDMQDYQQWLIKSGKSTSTFTAFAKKAGSALKSLGDAMASMAINWAIGEIISLAAKGIDNLIHASEKARETSKELTKEWIDENDSINKNISKYKELKKRLDDTSLSVSEIKDIKSELLGIQDSLTEKYGQEALNIDLVNGKYDEQIEKLENLSKLKAQIYKAQNYHNVQADRKYVTENVNLNKDLGYRRYYGDSLDKAVGFDIEKYIDKYNKLYLRSELVGGSNSSSAKINLITSGTREEVYNQLTSLFDDLSNDFGESNKDVNKFKDTLSKVINDSFDIQQLETSKNNIKKYAEAEILSNDKTRKLYGDAIKAVENYNSALSSGTDVEEAKANLDSIEERVKKLDIYAASDVFNDIYNRINKTAENAYKMSNAFENNNSVKKYAEQLKELSLSSDDLLKIDFSDEGKSIGEDIFKDLIDSLELSEDEVQNLIDKLVELGYVQGKVKDSTLSDEPKLISKEQIDNVNTYQSELKELYAALNLLRTGEMTPSNMDELIKKFPQLSGYVDDFDKGIRKLINDTLQLLNKSFKGLTDGDNLQSIAKFSVIQDSVANSIETTTNAINNLTSSYKTLNQAVNEYNENGYLSLETLENMMKLKPEYLTSIIDEEGNLKDITEVYKELIDLKLKEFETDAYKKANSVQAQLRDEYKGYLARSEDVGIYDKEYEEKHKEYTDKFKDSQITLEQELKFIQSARANLDKVAEGSGFGDITSSTSNFEQHIDWASHSISILQNKISLLQEELSNTSGYDNQIQKLDDIKKLQEDLYGGYEKTRDEYQKKYDNILNNGILAEQGLKAIIKKKIENGENFSIEDFIANNVKSGDTSIQQQIYEAIQEAIDWYNKKNEAEKNYLKVGIEIDETKASMHEVIRKKYDAEIARFENHKKSITDEIDLNGGQGTYAQYDNLIQKQKAINEIWGERYTYESELLKTLPLETEQYVEQEATIQNCVDKLAEGAKNIKDWQLDIVHLKLEAIDEEIDSINDKIKDNQNEIDEKDKLISGAIGILNQEVKVQEGLRDVIQDRIDALQKENDEYERALNLEKAKYELQRAYSQRTVKFYSGKEQGFIYTQDDEAVRDAQENLDKLEYEETIHALQKQVDYYNDIIDNLNDIKDIWSNISSAAQEFLDIENLISKYGVDIKDSILSGDYDTNSLTQFYKDLLNRKDEFNNSLEKQEDLRTDIEEIIERFQNGTITYEQCLTDIGILLGDVYDVSHTIIEQSVKDIVESTEIIPTEVNKANDAVKELEKNTQESASNINSELSAVSNNADKKSSETTEKITKNLEEELNNQRIILENFYGYVDNIFLNIRFSALDNFKKITDGMKETIESVKEEIEGIVTDTNNSVQSYVFSQPLKTSSVKNRPNKDSFALMKSGGLLTTKYKELDKFANSIGEDHITLLGYKEGERILTPAENEIWEKMNDIGISLMPNIAPDISSHSIKFPDIGAIQNKTTPVVQHVNVTIPNITNENGFNKFKQELERLQLDALQYTNRR